MIAVFADTSFYVALHNHRDSFHKAAVVLALASARPVVVTEFVLLEVANFFARPGDRHKYVELQKSIRTDPNTKVIPASSELIAHDLDLFAARPDKDWSLTDCISFVVMQEHGLAEALTADHHFEQAGFTALLKATAAY